MENVEKLPERSKTDPQGYTKIAISIFAGVFLQAGTIIWWASTLNQRVLVLEEWRSQTSQVLDRVTRVEERITGLKEQGARIETILTDIRDFKKRKNQAGE